MKYVDDPQLILMQNRTGLSLNQMADQINALARIAISSKDHEGRIATLESALAALTKPSYSYPMRVLDTDFVIDPNRHAIVNYTIDLDVTASLLGAHTNTAIVNLIVNGTSAGIVKNDLIAIITLGLSVQPVQRKILSGFVPAGTTVNLTSTIVGTGIATLVSAQEALL